MKYNEQIINKTVACTCKNKKYKVDKLLEMDAIQYCNLGINSTKAEKLEVKKRSRNIYRAIQKIDYALGKNVLEHQDK